MWGSGLVKYWGLGVRESNYIKIFKIEIKQLTLTGSKNTIQFVICNFMALVYSLDLGSTWEGVILSSKYISCVSTWSIKMWKSLQVKWHHYLLARWWRFIKLILVHYLFLQLLLLPPQIIKLVTAQRDRENTGTSSLTFWSCCGALWSFWCFNWCTSLTLWSASLKHWAWMC